MQVIARLEIRSNSIKPIIETTLPPRLNWTRWIEHTSVQKVGKFDASWCVVFACVAHPQIEIDVKRPLSYIDSIHAIDFDPSVGDALSPIIPTSNRDNVVLPYFLVDVDQIRMLNQDQLEWGRNKMAKTKNPDAHWARHIAVHVKIEQASKPADRTLRVIDFRQLGTHALSIGFFGPRSILEFCPTQNFDHYACSIIRAGCDPTRQPPRFPCVRGRKRSRCGTRTVEY